MDALSNEQYAANKALLCPYCREKNLAFKSFKHITTVPDGFIHLHVECCSCNAEFIEHYKIAGWEPFKTPPAEPKQ